MPTPTAPEAQASTRPLAERRWGRWALIGVPLVSAFAGVLFGWTAGLGVAAGLGLLALALGARREQQLLLRLARSAESMAALDMPLLILDSNDRVRWASAAYVALYPGLGQVAVGTPYETLKRRVLASGALDLPAHAHEAWLQARLTAHMGAGDSRLQPMADGRTLQVLERRTRLGGWACVFFDVTELVRTQQQLSEARDQAEAAGELLQQALDAMPAGFEIWDRDDRLLRCNRAVLDHAGPLAARMQPGLRFEDLARESLAAGLLPVPPEQHTQWLVERLAQRGRPGRPFLIEMNGRWTQVAERRMAGGGLVTVRQDVTELVEARRALTEAQAQLTAVIDTAGAAIATLGTDGLLRSVNQAAEALLGWRAEELVGQPAQRLVPAAAQQELLDEFKALLAGQPRRLGQRKEIPLVRRDGRVLTALAAFSEVKRGTEHLVVGVFIDVTEQRRAEAQLREANTRLETLSSTDALTGLANRRRLLEQLQLLWAHGQRESVPIAALLVDVDHFKRFNDFHGHQAGDAALVEVAQLLKQAARRGTDLAARYGGEEFVLLLDHCDLDAARARAEALREQLAARALPHGDAPLGRLSVSIGVAGLLPSRPLRPEELFSRADQALYRAKAAGRDQVAVY
jgi:diguanylate cyclase (GGDEF)-like protein/PAS domain S-box-containing protein